MHSAWCRHGEGSDVDEACNTDVDSGAGEACHFVLLGPKQDERRSSWERINLAATLPLTPSSPCQSGSVNRGSDQDSVKNWVWDGHCTYHI